MACHASCYQVEYEARNPKVTNATPNPNTNPCNSNANKTTAEANAKTQLDQEMVRKKEDVNNCTAEPGCSCPAWGAGGWTPWAINVAGLTSVQTVPIGTAGCRWTVILKYDRWTRSRSKDCEAS
jgi:hypothetical protein